jgi:aspartokinase
MVQISLLVKEHLNSRPFIQEGLVRNVISQGYLAHEIAPYIEKRLGKKVKVTSVMMAIRRYAEHLSNQKVNQFNLKGKIDITLKSNLCEITVLKSPTIFPKITKLYQLVNFNEGGILNIIQGNYEVTMITNESNKKKILTLFKQDKIKRVDSNLVGIALKYSEDYFETSGLVFTLVRTLAWENINICEYVSTLTESIFIVYEKDALNAYNAFQNLIHAK